MSYHSRRILTPGASRKRKEREALYSSLKPSSTASTASAPAPDPAQASKPIELKSSNRLLAGYMAYEFLTRGTLLGQKFDPASAEAVPMGSLTSAESKREAEPSVKKKEHQSYGEVASILKTEGTHIPDIVNPTQLARWIQM